MTKLYSVLFTLIFLGCLTAQAQADTSLFSLNPASAPLPVSWQVSSPYGRNIFYDFSSNANPTSYYGLIDNQVKSGDSSAVGGPNFPTIVGGKLGVTGGHSSASTGSETFTLGNLNLGANSIPQYVYLEMNVDLMNGTALTNNVSSVSLTLSNPVSLLYAGWAGTQTGINTGVLNPSLTPTLNGDTYTWSFGSNTPVDLTVDAWADLNGTPSSESLLVTLVGGAGGGTASISNLHIATTTTPEPMAVALFAVGGAILFFNRRRFAFQA